MYGNIVIKSMVQRLSNMHVCSELLDDDMHLIIFVNFIRQGSHRFNMDNAESFVLLLSTVTG